MANDIMSALSKKTQTKVNPTVQGLTEMFGLTDNFQITDLPISKLLENANHPFKITDNDEMMLLAESIINDGLLEPIIVRPRENGFYEILAGHRRTRAHEIKGLPTIKAIVALLFNELSNMKFKKVVQTISYLPHFVSAVVIVSIVVNFLSLDNGLINNIIEALGGEKIFFLNEPKYFRGIYTAMNLYKNIGWSSIVYISAISGVSPELLEACTVDGGNHWHKIRYVILPSISNTIIILFIMRMGSLLSIGYENIILMYNPKLYETADVIQTYVYRSGLLEANYSFSTAIGLFQSVVGMICLVITNYITRRVSEMSLW